MNARCPHHPQCPGCTLRELPPEARREKKRERVSTALALFSVLHHTDVLPCVPAPAEQGYRTRVKCAVASRAGTRAAIGLYRRNSHTVVDVPQCHVIVPELLPLIDDLRVRIPACSAPVAHLDIRWSVYQHKAHVTLVTQEPCNDNRFMKLAAGLLQDHPEVAGVGVRRPPSGHMLRPLSGVTVPIAGSSFLRERIKNFLFRLSPGSFFQASPAAAELLQELVASWCAPLAPVAHIVDLFAGTGLFAIGVAQYARKVTAIENTPQAVADAQASADLSGVALRVLALPVEQVCANLRGMVPDIIILDPPRRGTPLQVLEAVADARPARIIAVACDPETFARDVHVLAVQGYRLVQVVPLDLFPPTDHVETAGLLEKCTPVRRGRILYRDPVVLVAEKPLPSLAPEPQWERDSYPHLLHSPPAGATGSTVRMTIPSPQPAELEYLALVKGVPRKRGNLPLQHKPSHKLTHRQHYRLLSVIGGYGLVRIYTTSAARWEVPRQMHQIGHPILGDDLCGDQRTNRFLTETCALHRPCIHLHRITFYSVDGKKHQVTTPLPPDMRLVLQRLCRLREPG